MDEKKLNSIIKSLGEEISENIKLVDLSFETADVIKLLSKNEELQTPNSKIYSFFKKLLIAKYALHYSENDVLKESLGIKINFPYFSFGTINSRHFFGLDELLIHDFYIRNKNKYKYVADIGSNCGLHSKILCELGYEVDSFEPDQTHVQMSKKLLSGYKNNNFFQKAVSNYEGKAKFTRIINNSTGSYINDKKISYGPTETYEVEVINAFDLSFKYDLIKMDIEGSEADVFSAFDPKVFEKTDFIAEISTEDTRKILWDLFHNIGIKVYAQKIGWKQIKEIQDLPTSHREGSIFISQKNTWLS